MISFFPFIFQICFDPMSHKMLVTLRTTNVCEMYVKADYKMNSVVLQETDDSDYFNEVRETGDLQY